MNACHYPLGLSRCIDLGGSPATAKIKILYALQAEKAAAPLLEVHTRALPGALSMAHDSLAECLLLLPDRFCAQTGATMHLPSQALATTPQSGCMRRTSVTHDSLASCHARHQHATACVLCHASIIRSMIGLAL